jgi:transcription antitermination factor NusG
MTWSVVQCESQREHAVRLLLMRKYDTYLPQIKTRERVIPLLPTYLFVGLSEWRWSVRWTPHVVKLLIPVGQHVQFIEDFVTYIRKREHNGFVKLPNSARQIRKGQQVRIIRGSFEGKIGLYEGMSGHDRERVLLELLGQAVPVELPGKDIQPLNVVVGQSRMRY